MKVKNNGQREVEPVDKPVMVDCWWASEDAIPIMEARDLIFNPSNVVCRDCKKCVL